jgi:hypothetical protein
LGQDLFVLWKATLSDLRKDELAVYAHFEAATTGGQNDELLEVHLFRFEDFSRQTDGLGHVASGTAILNLDLPDHAILSSFLV